MRLKSISLGLTMIAIVAVGLVAAWRQPPSPTSPNPGEQIRFGTTVTGVFAALVWVAEHEGYFQHEGLDVDIRALSSAHIALQTMLEDGSLDLVGVAQTPLVFHSFTRSDYAIVATMADSDNNHKLLARTDRGIHTPADLRGKAVGVTKGTSGQFFLDMVLRAYGLDPAEVETVDLAVGALAPALVEGRVAAIATWEPHIAETQRLLGTNAFLFDTRNLVRTKFYVVAAGHFLAQHPSTVQRFLRAMQRAEVFIQEHKHMALDITARRLKITPELAAVVWEDLTFRLTLDQSVLNVLESEARWVINSHFTAQTSVPNYLPFIFADALKAVKPRAVTIAGK
jgi:NitT/TauT family transport system substrate-binding protein